MDLLGELLLAEDHLNLLELTVAKSGSRLTPAAAETKPGVTMSTNNSQARLMVSKGTIGDLARVIENEVGAMVIDKAHVSAFRRRGEYR